MLRDFDIVQELARDAWTVLVRAERRRDRLPVLIKSTVADTPTDADIAAFEREFDLLRALDVRGVPRAIGLLRFDRRRSLVMADPGGAPLVALVSQARVDLRWALRLSTQLLTVVGDLHDRNVIHGRVRPGAVLVDPDGHLSLLDFAEVGSASIPPAPVSLSARTLGNLPYTSPEQTGRMNRGIDHRSDLYSLGVLLYELLTGAPPFDSGDPLELVHWHLARVPAPLAGIDPLVAEPLASIVGKLLAKTADERYQTAAGARADLAMCLDALETQTPLVGFVPASLDASARFMVSERLYGREAELRALVETLEQVCAGGSSLALIGGQSGVGKTALIQELYKPLVRSRGYFTSGKFDQVARNVPFGALIQAFGGLIRQLLAEPEARTAMWRERLQARLGANGGVLFPVIPELEQLMGPQPAPPPLDGVEALHRFQMAFVNFLGALVVSGHPLVVFLDDLQWADAATLGLLKPLLTAADGGYLLIVGAYRTHDVDETHPLARTTRELDAAAVPCVRMTLGPLSAGAVEHLLVDTLRVAPPDIARLALVVHATTSGNPFFVVQFLKSLHRDGLIWFDTASRAWRFSIDAITDAATTDDVVQLMGLRIQRLSAGAQRTLTRAAFLGNRFDFPDAVVASALPPADVEADLGEAVAEGLLIPAEDTYRFLHDRVQQAAMEQIPPGDRTRLHLDLGRLFLRSWDREAAPERVFEIVGHLNAGSAFITGRDEQTALAALNLEAGRRAKASTAWDAAASYFDRGIGHGGQAIWTEDYDLGIALHLEAIECHYLAGHFVAAEDYASQALARAGNPMDAASVHTLRMVVHENRSRYEEAIASGKAGLALLGVHLPDDAGAGRALELELVSIEQWRRNRPIASLVDLPAMADPSTQMAMRILTALWSSAYIGGHQTIARLISATLVRLSLTLGNTEDSAYGYVTHAITVGPERGDYESAYEWGRLALAVNARLDDRKRRAKIHQQFHAHVCLWRRPFSECVVHARLATQSGLEAGDLNYAGYGAVTETWAALPIANDLAAFVKEYEPAVDLLERLHLDDFRAALQSILAWALALQGRTTAPTSLSHDDFDEDQYLKKFGSEVFFRTFLLTAKLQLSVLLEDVPGALAALRGLGGATLAGTVWPVLADFWGGLALTASFPSASETDRSESWSRLVEMREGLRGLASNAPENFRGFWLTLSAEMARVSLQFAEAGRLAGDAVEHAVHIGNLQQEALACEIAGRAFAQQDGEAAARPWFVRAAEAYDRWGASPKADQLRARHGLPKEATAGSRITPSAQGAAVNEAVASLDVATVLKISQSIAGELELTSLLPALMGIAIENAGAQRGLFIQEQKGRLVCVAEGGVDVDRVRTAQEPADSDASEFATSVAQYVRNTGEDVVVADALLDERFASDSYVRARRPRSILAVPVVHQGRVSGILYLEHALAAGVFTQQRVTLMRMISGQAAIALDNAGLYRKMAEEATQRRRAEEVLREVTEGTATALGEGFFRSLVQHLASALKVKYAFVTECRDARRRARTLAFWNGTAIADNIEYDVEDTPCKAVFEGVVGYYPCDVQRAFPKDLDLVTLKAESYLGAPMVDAGGQVIGHIAVLDERPMEEDAWAASVLSIFSARAGAELERLRAEQALRGALLEVETLKNRLQDENVYLQDEIREEHNFEDMVGRSPALLDVLRKVERVAATDATVLILGETGTGKELIARAVHSRSARRHRPLVKVNCGAISAGLVESELFGHVKGAFTGAIDKRVGRFELADGGTIFLDEVGEMPLDAQVKLLRVLQEKEFEPVGSSRTVRVDVRVIAATNRNLEQSIAEGRFRADLFFRLNVLSLTLPPLRDRGPDVPLLVTFLVTKFARQFGKPIEAVAHDTMRLLSEYPWPGNIREMQNVIERAVILSDGPVLSLGADLLPGRPEARTTRAALSIAGLATATEAPTRTMEETERRHIVDVLESVNYVIEGPNGAAQVLSLHPNTLRSRMKKLGIARPPAGRVS